MSKDEMIQLFSLERINKAGAKFDPEKTKWFNQQYLRKKTDEELAELFLPLLAEQGIQTDLAQAVKATKLIKEKAHFVNEFWQLGSFLFVTPKEYDKDVLAKRLNENTKNFVAVLRDALHNTSDFSAHHTESIFKSTAESLGLSTGQVMQLYRVALTGVSGGPSLFEIMEMIGKDETLKRLNLFLEKN